MTRWQGDNVKVVSGWIAAALVALSAGCAGRQAAAPSTARPEAASGEGVTRYGKQMPLLVERYLDASGERGENGWPLVVEITRIMDEVAPRVPDVSDDERIDFELVVRPRAGEEEKRARAITALKALEEKGLFARLDELGAARRVVVPAQDGDMLGWLLPEAGAFRGAVRAAAARMAQAAERGDAREAARSLERMMTVARVSSCEPWVIVRVVAMACAARGLDGARDYMMGRRLSADELRALGAAMERQLPLAPLSLAFEGDRLVHLDGIRMIYEDKTKSPEQWVGELAGEQAGQMGRNDAKTKEAVEWTARRLGLASASEARQFAEDECGRMIAMAELPMVAMLREAAAIEASNEDLPLRSLANGLFLPDPMGVVKAHVQCEAVIAGTRAMIAVELWRAEKAEYPESLAALVPGYLKSVPLDPYTGEALKYRRFAVGEDGARRGYLLYSVGLDGVDDGGKVHEDGPAAAAGPKGAGFDLVINAREKK